MRTLREQELKIYLDVEKPPNLSYFSLLGFQDAPPPSLGLGLRPKSSGLYKGAHFSKSAVREQGAVREQEPFGSRVIQ